MDGSPLHWTNHKPQTPGQGAGREDAEALTEVVIRRLLLGDPPASGSCLLPMELTYPHKRPQVPLP